MPRKPRILLAGYPHHIVQRGHDRQPVFIATHDYQYYLQNLKEIRSELNIRVYGFCLMTNHVHLLLEPVSSGASISWLMKTLAARQTRRVNRLENRRGTLWEGRFKSSIVDCSTYLLGCLRYVDLIPVRAAMVPDPGHYPWSSYGSLVSPDPHSWLDVHAVVRALGNRQSHWRDAYARFVAAAVPERELSLIRSAVHRNQLTGGDRFRREITMRTGRRIESRGPGRPRKQI